MEKLSGSKKIDEESEEKDLKTKPIQEKAEEGQLAVDVFQTESEIVVQSTIAGVKAEDLDITIQNDMVTVKGERKRRSEVTQDNYFYQECYWGPFSRSIILPEEVKADEARAELKDGVLTLHLPKSEKIKATKIGVKEVA
ncbi:MAG: Hsp20/alpha crystallin family protein [Candidatus Bathyarchaeota archaeon]|nr:Hsp20/alpha crystallin family protein [Candidatus Bathyarchaeota archaeon]